MSELPSAQQIRDWIAEHPEAATRRDVARAFGITGAARLELKRLWREIRAADRAERVSRNGLPAVVVLELASRLGSGEWLGRLPDDRLAKDDDDAAPPPVRLRADDPALAVGDRVLARLAPAAAPAFTHEAQLIRRLAPAAPRILGVFRRTAEGGRILPIDKGEAREWLIAREATLGARDGELVEIAPMGRRSAFGLPRGRITARLGDPGAPRAVSLIAIHQYGIPDVFPEAVVAEAEGQVAAGPEGRTDLRHLPLVTIDPADARDRDDAVCAMADPDPANPGGHLIWVAIADVAHHVRPGSELDREARKRGNSTYFPDRVVPMLPDRLSGDLCSLHTGVDRACIAVCLQIDAQGNKRSHRFVRGIMRAAAGFSYRQVQNALDGRPDEATAPLLAGVLRPIHAAWRALLLARAAREPLDIDLPERQIILSDEGKVLSVDFKERFDSHRIIEEFMVLANVAAAEELETRRRPVLYRIHEEPDPDRIVTLREVAQASGLVLAKGQVLQTRHLNNLLKQADGTDYDDLINLSVLRTMPQAAYSARNLGHFGLALRRYAHFTAPIRRYADLIVHRALISAHGWGDGGLSAADVELLEETATAISATERRSMAAERDTTDRYLAAWLAERLGAEFTGRITGVQRFGLFVRLDESGADGLVPIREIGREFFHFDPGRQSLLGADTGLELTVGQRVTVRLIEAAPVSGGLVLELLTVDGADLPSGRAARARKSGSGGSRSRARRAPPGRRGRG